ncbi:hypothetical protein RHMOL_Rhmol04G0180300 [Rhododendron molle]|uniref:Uncharacterized protein n=1 Tax=Rhododendron molle TaxID=49168 RepID=A0ACC0P1U6_RHOML|nr:hypothetical protein RHMOL_Rhmol04G0180300 [Rhododendron molle]
MEIRGGDQQPMEATTSSGAMTIVGGDGEQGRDQEVGGEPVRRTPEPKDRATESVGAVKIVVEPMGSNTMARDSLIVEGNSGEAGGSGAEGGDAERIGSPSRDSTRGKGIVTGNEETTEALIPYREEDVLFRAVATAATSSSHRPITKYDIAEHLPNEALAKLLEDNPAIGELALKAKEE